ncbi:MAG: DUF3108 domain-containing protein [Gammaproteobacteria bacterium]|nr:MAG: DUF3108 domain-containing protein [Gammaproteobacteria bacterium]
MNWLSLRKHTVLLLLAGLTCSWSGFAANPPQAFAAKYKLEKYNSVIAIMDLTLQHQDDKIIYRSQTTPKGLLDIFSDDRVTEQSQLQWKPEQQDLRLIEYQYQRAEKPKDNQQFSLHWNDDNSASCTGTARQQAFTLSLQQPAWDRLSVQLALMMDLSRDTRPRASYSYHVIDNAEMTEYQFQLESEDTIELGQQQYHTLKYKRAHDSGKRLTYFWLVPELDYLPVRIEQHKKGELHLSMELAEPIRVTP